jgi:hypothetical protein
MLPVGPLVSGLPSPLVQLVRGVSACFEALPIPHSWRSWTPRGPTHPRPAPRRAHAAQRQEQERVARRMERRLRRRERREGRDEEFRLREQHGLSPPATSEDSSSSSSSK